MQPSGRGYDHGITTFSPDGRLFQVEYARESVKRGTTTAGLKFRDGVVLVCDKRIVSRLIIPESIEKMFKIKFAISEIAELKNVGEIISLIIKKKK